LGKDEINCFLCEDLSWG